MHLTCLLSDCLKFLFFRDNCWWFKKYISDLYEGFFRIKKLWCTFIVTTGKTCEKYVIQNLKLINTPLIYHSIAPQNKKYNEMVYKIDPIYWISMNLFFHFLKPRVAIPNWSLSYIVKKSQKISIFWTTFWRKQRKII